jgi:hypothetical protein
MVALFVIDLLPRDPNKKLSQNKIILTIKRLLQSASLAPVPANGGRPGDFLKHDLTKHILERFAGDPDDMRKLTAKFLVVYITVCSVLD